MMRIDRVGLLMAVAFICLGWPAAAQERQDTALRAQVERRFDVLPLRDGLALRPRAQGAGVRSIEIAGGTIALDGAPATGAELRARLGADADLVLRLSYLDDAQRRALFASPAVPAPPAAPAPPADVAPPPPPPPPPPPAPERRRERRDGDRVRVGGSVSVDEGETIDGDVVAVGGSVRVDGEVLGDVVAVGGGIVLGPKARIEDNVVVVGGRVTREEGAEVGGRVQEVGITGVNFGDWTWRRNPVVRQWWGTLFALVGTLTRVAVLCLLAALVVLFGREYMVRAGSVAQAASVKAGLVGFLAQLLFIPLLVVTIVVLVMTIVGIPLLLLLPFAFLALAAFALVGFTAVANLVGSALSRRFGWSQENPYLVTITGVLVLMLPVILSRVTGLGGGVLFPVTIALGIGGALVEYLAWTIGIGAVALARFNRRHGAETTLA